MKWSSLWKARKEEHEETEMREVRGRQEQDPAQKSPAKQRDGGTGKQPAKGQAEKEK